MARRSARGDGGANARNATKAASAAPRRSTGRRVDARPDRARRLPATCSRRASERAGSRPARTRARGARPLHRRPRAPRAARGPQARRGPRARAPSRRPSRAGCRRPRAPRRCPHKPRRPPSARRSSRRRRRARRPPWFETTTPAAPCSQASAASSRVSTPLTSTGSPDSDASRSTSRHDTDSDIHENASSGVTPPLPSAGTVTSVGSVKPVRRSRSRRPSTGVSTVSTIAEAAVARLRDEIARHTVVGEDIKLEPAGDTGRGDLSRSRRRHRRKAHAGPDGRSGGARHRHLPIRMSDTLECDGSDEERHREPLAEHGCLGRAACDIDQNARAAASDGRPRRSSEASARPLLRPRSSRARPPRGARRRVARNPRR